MIAIVTGLGTYSLTFADDSLDSINKQKSEATTEMGELVEKIKTQQTEVDKINASVASKQSEINTAQAKINETKKNIETQQSNLDKRLRTMYKNGSVGFLDVLFSSSSITEFISNVELVQKIYQSDQETLTTLQKQHKELETLQASLEKQQSELKTQQAEVTSKMAELQKDKNALQTKINALNEEADRITSEIQGGQDSDAVYEGGQFQWPTTSHTITSSFGYRIHPITGIWTGHTGVDIAANAGSPVYAAADGKVILARWYGGYGNAVVIDHGSGISTLYGHNSRLLVSNGQTVKRGQQIAKAGSTGWSTGPHVHFEVRINGNYVNPMNYF